MTTYSTKSVSTKLLSSAYTGELSVLDEVCVHVDGVNVMQNVYADVDEAPAPIPLVPSGTAVVPPLNLTSVIPRHGENVASPQYLPPVCVVQRFGQLTPETTPDPTDTRFIRSDTGLYYTSNRLWILAAAVNALTGQDPSFLPSIGNINSLISNADLLNQTFSGATLATSAGTYIFEGPKTLSSVASNASGDVIIFCDGDLTITSLATVINGMNLTIMVTGNLIVTSGDELYTPSIALGNLVIFAGGNVTYTHSASPRADYEFNTGTAIGAAGTLSYNGSSGSTFSTSAVYCGANGEITANSGNVNYGLTGTFTIAGTSSFSSHPQHKVIYVDSYYTIWGTSLTALSEVGAGVTLTYVKFVALGGASEANLEEILEAFKLIFAAQYRLGYNAFTSIVNNSGNQTDNATQEIRTLFNGYWRETMIVLEFSSSVAPNIGINTEPHGFDSYVETMMQSYRVDDNAYAVLRPGRYLTVGSSWKIVVSSVDYTVTVPYNLQIAPSTTMSIATASTKLILDTLPPAPPVGTEGGMDAFNAEWKSTYRALMPAFVSGGATMVRVKAPYNSFVRYSPNGGRIVSASPLLISGSLRVHNSDRLSRVMHVPLVVEPTWQTGAVTKPLMNMGAFVYSTSSVYTIVYISNTVAHLWWENQLYVVLLNTPTTIGTYGSVTYTLSGVTATITGTAPFTIAASAPSSINVALEILFGDMVGTPRDRSSTSESFEHFVRTVEGLYSMYLCPYFISGTDNDIDITHRTEAEIEALMLNGFIVDDNIARRITVHSEPIKIGGFTVLGRRVIHCPFDATEASVAPIIDGTYGSVLPNTLPVEVVEGKVSISAFPFHIGYYTYTLVIDEQVDAQFLEIELTPGDLLTMLQSSATALIVSSTGVTITRSSVNGSVVFSTIVGTGVVIFILEGKTYRCTVTSLG